MMDKTNTCSGHSLELDKPCIPYTLTIAEAGWLAKGAREERAIELASLVTDEVNRQLSEGEEKNMPRPRSNDPATVVCCCTPNCLSQREFIPTATDAEITRTLVVRGWRVKDTDDAPAGSFCPYCFAAQKASPDFKDAEAYRRHNWDDLLMNVTFEPLSRSEWFSSTGGPAFQALNGFPHPIRVLVFREPEPTPPPDPHREAEEELFQLLRSFSGSDEEGEFPLDKADPIHVLTSQLSVERIRKLIEVLRETQSEE